MTAKLRRAVCGRTDEHEFHMMARLTLLECPGFSAREADCHAMMAALDKAVLDRIPLAAFGRTPEDAPKLRVECGPGVYAALMQMTEYGYHSDPDPRQLFSVELRVVADMAGAWALVTVPEPLASGTIRL